MANLIDKAILRKFVPANALNFENFEELAGKTVIEEVAAGKALFKEGDTDRKAVYLVEGEVELTNSSGQKSIIKAGTDPARAKPNPRCRQCCW